MRSTPDLTPSRRRALAVVAVAVTALVAVTPAGAAPRPEGPVTARSATTAAASVAMAAPSPDLPGLPPVSVALAAVPVDSSNYRKAQTSYAATAGTFEALQSERVEVDRAITDLTAQLGRAEAALVAGRARRAAAASRLDAVNDAIADLGVALYLSGGSAARIDAALTAEQPSINEMDQRYVLGNASLDVLLGERAAYETRVEEATARIEEASTLVRDLRTARRDLRAELPEARHAEATAAPAVAEERVRYEEARVLAKVVGVEFPLVALDAYYRASRAITADDPGCGVQWWAIAGISRVEGHHGTYGGAALDKLGDATKKIIGIQLNGTNDTRVITDSDGGALDGDPAYDRAVGPMQFIPQTWSRFASDGNDDGVLTPFNLYDATLAAARYLCRASGGLAEDPGLRTAYFSYNNSDAYVERVLSFARLYEHAVDIPR